jgi:hypothetical protein
MWQLLDLSNGCQASRVKQSKSNGIALGRNPGSRWPPEALVRLPGYKHSQREQQRINLVAVAIVL